MCFSPLDQGLRFSNDVSYIIQHVLLVKKQTIIYLRHSSQYKNTQYSVILYENFEMKKNLNPYLYVFAIAVKSLPFCVRLTKYCRHFAYKMKQKIVDLVLYQFQRRKVQTNLQLQIKRCLLAKTNQLHLKQQDQKIRYE